MRPFRFSFVLAAAVALSGCGAGTPEGPAAPRAAEAPDGPAELFARGRAAAERGDTVRAQQYLAWAIERGYDRRAALPTLLRACVSSLHLRAALDHADQALREHPDDDALRYLVATIHLGLGQEAHARRELERLLRHDPNHADGSLLLGVLLTSSDRAAAGSHFRRYLAALPHGPRAAEARSRLAELEAEGGAP